MLLHVITSATVYKSTLVQGMTELWGKKSLREPLLTKFEDTRMAWPGGKELNIFATGTTGVYVNTGTNFTCNTCVEYLRELWIYYLFS